MVKVIIDREGLFYSNWLPLIAGDSIGFVGFINTFKGIFYIKGITIIRLFTTGIALFFRIPNFLRFRVALRGP